MIHEANADVYEYDNGERVKLVPIKYISLRMRSGAPGMALGPVTITPFTLSHNIRAPLFPDVVAKLRFNLSLTLVSTAVSAVNNIEKIHESKCPSSNLVSIQAVRGLKRPTVFWDFDSKNLDFTSLEKEHPGAVIDGLRLPWTTKLCIYFFSPQPTAQLLNFAPGIDVSHLPQVISADGSVRVMHPMKVLGAEVWEMDRCDSKPKYFIQYLQDGDTFHSTAFPMNFAASVSFLRSQFRRRFYWMYPPERVQVSPMQKG